VRPLVAAIVVVVAAVAGLAAYRHLQPAPPPPAPVAAPPVEDAVCKQLRQQLTGLGLTDAAKLTASCARWSAAKRLCVMSARTAPNAVECVKMPNDLGRAPAK
jgi:hypothetical protein